MSTGPNIRVAEKVSLSITNGTCRLTSLTNEYLQPTSNYLTRRYLLPREGSHRGGLKRAGQKPILLTFLPCRQSVGKFFPAYRSVPKKFTRQAPIRGKSPDHSKTPPNPPFMLKQKHAPYHPVPGKSVHAQPTVCDVTTRCHCHPPHPPQPSLTSAPH